MDSSTKFMIVVLSIAVAMFLSPLVLLSFIL